MGVQEASDTFSYFNGATEEEIRSLVVAADLTAQPITSPSIASF
jgi:hypothetical protein